MTIRSAWFSGGAWAVTSIVLFLVVGYLVSLTWEDRERWTREVRDEVTTAVMKDVNVQAKQTFETLTQHYVLPAEERLQKAMDMLKTAMALRWAVLTPELERDAAFYRHIQEHE